MNYQKPGPKHARKALWLTTPSGIAKSTFDAKRLSDTKAERKSSAAKFFGFHIQVAPMPKEVEGMAVVRGNDGLIAPNKSIVVRKPIRRVTKSLAARKRKYNLRVKVWLAGKKCQCCQNPSEHTHHSRGRIGRLLLDERFWIPLCSFHHAQVHASPAWAREQGLLCDAFKFNSVPK